MLKIYLGAEELIKFCGIYIGGRVGGITFPFACDVSRGGREDKLEKNKNKK